MARLAAALGCEPAELMADADLPAGGSTDRLAAARLLSEPGIIDTFTGNHQFGLLETMLRAQLDVALPTADRGRLYCKLGLALFRQSELAESRPCFRYAARLAQLAGDRALSLSAGMQHSYTQYLGGDVAKCLRLDEANLAAARADGNGLQIAANLSNVGDLLRAAGRFDEARGPQLDALERYRRLDRPTNIVFCQLKLAALELDLGRFSDAQTWAEAATRTSSDCGFQRGVADALMASAAALGPDEVQRGPVLALRARRIFENLGIDEPAMSATHSRILRRAGNVTDALAQARHGLKREQRVGNRPARARLLFEGALALRESGAGHPAERRRLRDSRRKCLTLYRAAGIPLRCEIVAQALT